MACTLDSYYSWTLPSPRLLSALNQDETEESSSTRKHNKRELDGGMEDEPCQIARKLLFDCWKQDHSPPSGNLWKGGLGTYLVLMEYALKEKNTKSIYRRKHYLMKVYDAAQHAVNEYESRIDGTTEGCRKNHEQCISILQSEWVGGKAMLGICQWHLGDKGSTALLNRLMDKILHKASHASTKHNNTVLSGRAGALQALFWIRKELKDPYWRIETAVELAKQILQGGTAPTPCNADAAFNFDFDEEIISPKSGPPSQLVLPSPAATPKQPRRSRHRHNRNGASKGQIGILHTLLNLSNTEWELLEAQVPGSKKLVQIEIDSLTHQGDNIDWAHGATSLALLWIRASQVFQSKTYLLQAYQLCESTIWPKSTDSNTIGLAKGLTGIAFLSLLLADFCEKPISTLWRRRSEFLARMALTQSPTDSKEKYSLYHGLGGLASLLLQLQADSKNIQIPLYGMGYSNEWLREPDQLERIALVEAEVPELPDSEAEDGTLVDSLEEVLSKSWEYDEEEDPSEPLDAAETATTTETTPSRPFFAKPHYEVQTRESFFWSLQTDANIGNSEDYRPALINTTPKASHAKPPMTPRSSSMATPSPTTRRPDSANRIKNQPSTDKTPIPLSSTTPKSVLTNRRPPTTPRSLPSSTPTCMHHRDSLSTLDKKSESPKLRSSPRRIERTGDTLPGSEGKVRLTRAVILRKEALALAALHDVVMPSESLSMAPYQIKKETLAGSNQKYGTPSRCDHGVVSQTDSTCNTPQRTTPNSARATGSSGKVRLTRAALLKQQCSPANPHNDGGETFDSIHPQENSSSTTPRSTTVRTGETLVGSHGKVRMTRSAILKQQSTPKRKYNVEQVAEPRNFGNHARTVSTRESLSGNGAKVRMTRSAILRLQATPVRTYLAAQNSGENERSGLELRRSKSMTPLKTSSELLSGTKVRLTRSAKLKMESLFLEAKRVLKEEQVAKKFLLPMKLVYLGGPVTSDLGDEMGHPNDMIGERIVKTIKYESFTPTNNDANCPENKKFFHDDGEEVAEKELQLKSSRNPKKSTKGISPVTKARIETGDVSQAGITENKNTSNMTFEENKETGARGWV